MTPFRFSFSRCCFPAWVALFGVSVLVNHAHAQTPRREGKLAPPRSKVAAPPQETLKVVGQRQPYIGGQKLLDIPQNVAVLSAATLRRAGITTLTDALQMVSGVAQQNSFGGLWDQYAVRGFVGDTNMPSAYLINGFNYGRGFGGPRDLSGVERIEVLKGPTSALFGRGDPGGTVDIITRKPQFVQAGSVDLRGGSFNSVRVGGDYTRPIGSAVAIRLNGAFQDADSFRHFVHTRKYTFAPSILWNIDDRTNISYQYLYTHQSIPLDRGIIALNGHLGVIPNSRFLGEPADGAIENADSGHQLQLQHDFSRNWNVLVGFGDRQTHLEGLSETPELAAARQTLYRNGTSLARQRRFTDFETRDLVYRAELNGIVSTWALRHHIRLGMDADQFRFASFQSRYRPPIIGGTSVSRASNAIDIFNPVYGTRGSLPGVNTTIFNQVERQRGVGGYAQDEIDLTAKVKVRLGGRIDDFRQRITLRADGSQSGQHPDAFSPQAGIVYEPFRTVSLYAAYGKGFRPNTGTDFAGTPLAPERTTDYEIGAKYTSQDRRVQASLALYRMTKTNIVTADPVHSGYNITIGSAESRGVEADINTVLGAGFHMIASASYVDAFTTSTVRDPDFGRLVMAGSPLINVPKWSANILLEREFEVARHHASLGAQMTYSGRRLGETGAQFFLPSYTLVRLLGAVDITQRLRASAEVNNLLGARWYANSYSALWVMPGAPRTAMFQLRYAF